MSVHAKEIFINLTILFILSLYFTVQIYHHVQHYKTNGNNSHLIFLH